MSRVQYLIETNRVGKHYKMTLLVREHLDPTWSTVEEAWLMGDYESDKDAVADIVGSYAFPAGEKQR